MSGSALAGLPRLVRAAPELRWRGGAALGTGAATVVFWISTWLVGESIDLLWSTIGFLAIAAPVTFAMSLTRPRRVDDSLRIAHAPPRSSVYETQASARERRTRLAGIVLGGVIALLAFDRIVDGGGTTAGLVAGLFMSFGGADLLDARRFGAAEAGRTTRIYYLVPPLAFTARFGVATLYEETEGSQAGFPEASPFDLEL